MDEKVSNTCMHSFVSISPLLPVLWLVELLNYIELCQIFQKGILLDSPQCMYISCSFWERNLMLIRKWIRDLKGLKLEKNLCFNFFYSTSDLQSVWSIRFIIICTVAPFWPLNGLLRVWILIIYELSLFIF